MIQKIWQLEKCASMRLTTAILLLGCLSICEGQEIRSTGQHASGEFSWPVGVDNLSFNISFSGVTSVNYSNYVHDWLHVSTDGATFVSFRTEFGSSSSLGRPLCYYGTNFNNPPYASLYGIDYRIDCSLVGSTLDSQFTIISPLNSSYNGSMLRVVSSGAIVDTKELKLVPVQNKDEKIMSTGYHASTDFLWAVGVDNLSFNFTLTVPTITISNFYNYIHDWYHTSKNGAPFVSFRVSFNFSNDGSVIGVDCYNGTNVNNPPYASANRIYYKIDCELIGSTLKSRFTIVSSLDSSYNGSRVHLSQTSTPPGNYTKQLTLKYCDELVESDHMMISGGTKAEYNNIAMYTCSNSALVVDNTYDKNINTYSITCGYDAIWSGQGSEVDCWFAPEVDVSIEQNGSGTLISEDVCTINCNTITKGNPPEANIKYYKNGVQISNKFNVTSSDNGVSVSCQMANSYVNEVDSSDGFSPSITLNVLYQPEPLDGNFEDSQSAVIGQDYSITIKFNANPNLPVSDTTMYFEGIELDPSNASINVQDNLHTYEYQLSSVAEDSFGIYILSTISPAPQLAGRVTNFTVILRAMQLADTTGLSTDSDTTSTLVNQNCVEEEGLTKGTVAAISICIGLLVGAVASSAVWWWMLRRSKKEPMNAHQKEPEYEPTYVDATITESGYSNIDQVRGGQIVSQQQTNINDAYEVIR